MTRNLLIRKSHLPTRYCFVCVPTTNEIANYWNEWWPKWYCSDVAFVKIALYKIPTKMLQISKSESSGEKANDRVYPIWIGIPRPLTRNLLILTPKRMPSCIILLCMRSKWNCQLLERMTKWYRSDFRWNFLIRDFSSKFEWTLKFPHSKYLQRCFKYRKVKVWVKNPTTALSNLNWDITIDIDLPARYCSVCVPTINQIANYWNEWRNDIAVIFVKIFLYKIPTKILQISKSSGEKVNDRVIQFELGSYNRYHPLTRNLLIQKLRLLTRYCSVCIPTTNEIANYWNEWRNDIAVTFVKISLYKISTKMLQISKSSGEKANCVIQFELGYYNRYSIDAKLVNPKVTPKPLESGGSKTVGRSQGAWSRSASVILDLSICLPKVS